eukprot:gene9016-18670_t
MVDPGYRPLGWLGLMMGSKLYYDISDKTRIDDSINKIVANELGINKSHKQVEVEVEVEHEVDNNNAHMEQSQPMFKDMSQRQVREWLVAHRLFETESEIQGVGHVLGGCDGRVLHGLRKVLRRDGEAAFVVFTTAHIGLTAVAALTLAAELE